MIQFGGQANQDEYTRKEEEKRRAEEAKNAEEAERRQREAEKKAAELARARARLAEEAAAKQAEQAAKEAEKRKKEEAKKAEEEEQKRKEEEKRRQEEARSAAEAARKTQEAEEKRRAEEAKKAAEEKKKQDEERKKQEEKTRKEEIARLHEEEEKAKEVERQQHDGERKAAEEEKKRREAEGKIKQEEEKKRANEAEKSEEEAKKRRESDEKAKKAAEEARARQEAEKKATEEAKRKEEEKRLSAEAKGKQEAGSKAVIETKKLATTLEDEKKRLEEEAKRARLAEKAAAKQARLAEAETAKRAEEAKKKQHEAEKKAIEDARKAAEQTRRQEGKRLREEAKKRGGRRAPLTRGALRQLNIAELFSTREKIAGLSIDEFGVRAAFLGEGKPFPKTQSLSEVALPEGTIREGKVANPDALVLALQKLQTSDARPHPLLVPFVILSVPIKEFWVNAFRFPSNLTHEQIQEAMTLNTQLGLPFESTAIVSDWEERASRSPEFIEALLIASVKDSVEPYITACQNAGLTVVATEVFGLSWARTLRLVRAQNERKGANEKNEVTTGAFLIGNMFYEFVSDGTTPEFIRAVYEEDFHGRLVTELKLFLNFVSSEYAALEPQDTLCLEQFPEFMPREELAGKLGSGVVPFLPQEIVSTMLAPLGVGVKNTPSWFAALGAALRGLVPRASDTFVSLMAVGTEASYQRRRAFVWMEQAGNFMVSIAAFLFLLFGASFGFVVNQERTVARIASTQAQAPSDVETLLVEAKIFNQKIALANQIVAITARWGNVFYELRAAGNIGVTLRRVLADEVGAMQLSGYAASAETLVQFKSVLEAGPLATSIGLPATVFQEEGSIEFNLQFRMKDPTFLYRQP